MKETRKFYIEDLMIGDWVRWEGCAGNFRVCSIDGRSLMVEIEKHEPEKACGWNADVFIFELFGIPITPEILEKNGFKKNGKYNEWNIGEWNERPFIGVSLDRQSMRITDLGTDIFVVRQVVCVHQLQHALRLAGIEKEIEL